MKEESSNIEPHARLAPDQSERVGRRVGVALAVLIGLTVLFLGFTALHRRPMEAFELSASSFVGFEPRIDGWVFEKRPVPPDPIEPNILSYRVAALQRQLPGSSQCSLRLVHGYNVRDCMRIKGYGVEEVRSVERGTKHQELSTGRETLRTTHQAPSTTHHAPGTTHQAPSTKHQAPGTKHQAPSTKHQAPGTMNKELGTLGQVWRMVSPAGVTSVWVTVMLKADTNEATDRDVCSMPFPRVGVPDDPDWSPGGITVEGFRHPVDNVRRVVRAKWNASRSDLLTFLGFRRPAWVQAEWLTLVAACDIGGAPDEGAVAVSLQSLQAAFVQALQEWQRKGVNGR